MSGIIKSKLQTLRNTLLRVIRTVGKIIFSCLQTEESLYCTLTAAETGYIICTVQPPWKFSMQYTRVTGSNTAIYWPLHRMWNDHLINIYLLIIYCCFFTLIDLLKSNIIYILYFCDSVLTPTLPLQNIVEVPRSSPRLITEFMLQHNTVKRLQLKVLQQP